MASSRPQLSPEMDLRHWLGDLAVENIVVTGKEVRRAAHYSTLEVQLGGLDCTALQFNEEELQLEDAQPDEFTAISSCFAEECHRYARLRHTNLLQFLGVFFPLDKRSVIPLVVIERLEFTLGQCLQRFPSLPAALKISILLDVSLGLQCLHSASPPIPHQGLNANSVFLTPGLQAKVTYPGICSALGEFLTPIDDMQLTTAFPEFSRSSSGNCKEDVFSFGELMIHVITQRRPKRAQSGFTPSLIHQVEHVDSTHPLRGLIMQCLQKNSSLRPSADEITSEIKMVVSEKNFANNDPTKMLNLLTQKSNLPAGQVKNSTPTENKLKRLEAENSRLTAQLKITQAELRHLKVKQTIFADTESLESEEEEEEEPKKRVECKDAAIQVEILQSHHKKVYVELQKDGPEQSLGFTIAGGRGSGSTFHEGDEGIFITRVAADGLADKDGRLRPGDKLISVNGKDMIHASRSEALAAVMTSGDVCTIVVLREETSMESEQPAAQRRTLSTRRKLQNGRKMHPLKLGVTIQCEPCSPVPDAISEAQAVLYNSKVCIGGQYSKGDCSIIYQYDPDTNTWEVLARSPVFFFGMTVFQEKLILAGGLDAINKACSDKLFSWGEREKSWNSTLPSMPTARMHASTIAVDNSLVVAGGRNEKATLNCIEVFCFASQQWYTAHPLLLEQCLMKTVVHKGYWYLLGGEKQGFATTRALYTPLRSLVDSALHKSGSVSCFKAIPSLPNAYSSVSVLGNTIVAVGGKFTGNSAANSIIYALSEKPLSWLEVGELPLPLSHSSAVAISDYEILVIGGRDENGDDTNEVYHLYLQDKIRAKSVD